MATMHGVLNKELTKQTKMMLEDQERTKRIDQATAQHQGDPMRLPRNGNFKNKK